MTKPVKIFVSSTSEFEKERADLKSELSDLFELFCYEDVPARSVSPKQYCEENIRDSEIFIGILGRSWGSALPGDEGGRSIVEWEFAVAEEQPALDLMVFLGVDPGDETIDPRQKSFVSRMTAFEGGLWAKRFQSPNELLRSVTKSLLSWFSERRKLVKQGEAILSAWAEKRVLLILVLSALLALSMLVPQVQSRLSVNGIIVILICAFLAALSAIVLWKREDPGHA